MESKSHLSEEEIERARNYLEFYNNDYLDFLRSTYTSAYENSVNKDYYIAYENIVKRTAELMDKLKIKDYSLLVNLVFEYLLWGGYLSKDHKLIYRMKKRINNFSCIGADIMLGYSVCLNNAEMLSRVYRELGYDSHTIGISVKRKNINDITYKPDIERNKYKNSIFNSFFPEYLGLLVGPLIGNHAVTLVKENGIYILYDPTNLTPIYLQDLMKAHYIGSENLMDLKAWIMLTIENLSNEEFENLVLAMMAQGKINPNLLSHDIYKDIMEKYMVVLKSEEKYLEKFYEDNKNDIDIVSKSLVNGKKGI